MWPRESTVGLYPPMPVWSWPVWSTLFLLNSCQHAGAHGHDISNHGFVFRFSRNIPALGVAELNLLPHTCHVNLLHVPIHVSQTVFKIYPTKNIVASLISCFSFNCNFIYSKRHHLLELVVKYNRLHKMSNIRRPLICCVGVTEGTP